MIFRILYIVTSSFNSIRYFVKGHCVSMKDGQFDVQSTESARSMTDESTEIPSYLNIKEIKIELKAGFEAKEIF